MSFSPPDFLEHVVRHAAACGADAADLIYFRSAEANMSRRLGKPEGLERAESAGLGLRVFCGKQQAIVSSTDMRKDTLHELAERAVAMAKASPADPFAGLPPSEILCHEMRDLDLWDEDEPSAEWMTHQCKEAEETALSVAGITNSEGADAGFTRNQTALLSLRGKSLDFAHAYQSSYVSISVSVLAGEGTGMERDYAFSSARHRVDLLAAKEIGKQAAERALRRLNPRKAGTCQVPVVFDPRVSRALVAQFASAISGAAIARGTSFLKDALGKPVFCQGISIIDDPHRLRGLASRPFDAEGVNNPALKLVENGVLQHWLLDMRSATQLAMVPNGRAARGMAAPPSPSATNLYMEAGILSPEEIIRQVGTGFYVTETFGHGGNLITGDYSQGASGLWIEDGELAYPVSEVTVAGQMKNMFQHATAANDLMFHYAINAPTLRIDGMTVAGA